LDQQVAEPVPLLEQLRRQELQSLVFQRLAFRPQQEQADLPVQEQQRLVQPALLPQQGPHPELEPQGRLRPQVQPHQVHHKILVLPALLLPDRRPSQVPVFPLSELLPGAQRQPLVSLPQQVHLL
jgi:hypothetical protein